LLQIHEAIASDSGVAPETTKKCEASASRLAEASRLNDEEPGKYYPYGKFHLGNEEPIL